MKIKDGVYVEPNGKLMEIDTSHSWDDCVYIWSHYNKVGVIWDTKKVKQLEDYLKDCKYKGKL